MKIKQRLLDLVLYSCDGRRGAGAGRRFINLPTITKECGRWNGSCFTKPYKALLEQNWSKLVSRWVKGTLPLDLNA